MVVVGTTLAAASGSDVRNARDVQGFAAYVTHTADFFATTRATSTILPDPDQRWAAEHPEAMLAEGDRACEWLNEQPNAPDVDPDLSYETHALTLRYLSGADLDERVDQTHLGQIGLVAGAWEYLCRNTRTVKTTPYDADGD